MAQSSLAREETALAIRAFMSAARGEDRIRSRYDRLWSNVVEALPLVRDLTVYDNSSAANPLRVIARFHGGGPVRDSEWPAWAHPDLMSLHPPG